MNMVNKYEKDYSVQCKYVDNIRCMNRIINLQPKCMQ